MTRAKEYLKQSKEFIKSGLRPDSDIYAPQARISVREEEVIEANRRVDNAQAQLKKVLHILEVSGVEKIRIKPISAIEVTIKDVKDKDVFRIAFEKRDDYAQYRKILENREINYRLSNNQRLWRADLNLNYGLAGEEERRHDSGDNLTTFNYPSYSVGIDITIPIGNRSARANYKIEKFLLAQSKLGFERIKEEIVLSVRLAINDFRSNILQINAAKRSIAESLRQYEAEKVKFELGIGSPLAVLDYQERLARSETEEARSRTFYSIALARLWREQGILLEMNNISYKNEEKKHK